MNKRFHIFNFLIFLLLLLVNTIIYFNRDNGFAYKEKLSYDQLYQIKDDPKIIDLDVKESKVVVQIQTNEREERQITLVPGKKIYFLPLNNDTIKLGFNFTPQSEYAASGRTRPDVVELYSTNITIGNFPLYALQDWQYKTEYRESEWTVAEKILKDEARINPKDADLLKIQKTARHLLKTFDSKLGIPTDSMDRFSGMERYHFATNGRSKVWCGDLASMYSFFLRIQNIPSRLVSLEGKINEVYKAGHVFTEIYLVDQKQWIFSDLTSGAIFIQDINGRYLNTLDYYEAHKRGVSLHVISTKDSVATTQRYDQIKPFYDYYFQSNNSFTYYLKEQFSEQTYDFLSKLKRYLLPSPTFAMYAGYTECDNTKFHIKQFAFFLLLLFSIYWIIVTFLLRLKNRTAI